MALNLMHTHYNYSNLPSPCGYFYIYMKVCKGLEYEIRYAVNPSSCLAFALEEQKKKKKDRVATVQWWLVSSRNNRM